MRLFSRLAACAAYVSAAAPAAAPPSATPGVVTYESLGGAPYTVTADKRSFMVNGQRSFFFSAGIHYVRSTPMMWEDILGKIKADGHNMIQTYVFWNAHQHKQDTLDFGGSANTGVAGSANLTAFLLAAQAHGLFVNLRIGPYVCAEYNFGGYPYWLTTVPNLRDRSSSSGWEAQMGAFFNATVSHFRSLGLFADRGGPIALAQVENELNTGDGAYVDWCGNLAAAQGLPIPWLMCNGDSAPNTINSCNGGDCQGFIEGHGQNHRVLVDQPAAWTEKWSPWYQQWSDGSGDLPAYDGGDLGAARGEIFSIAKWFARGGGHVNWYMAHGGNNYRRLQGAGTRPEYYTGAQYNPDGVRNEPFASHTAAFYAALGAIASDVLANPAMVNAQVDLPFSTGGGAWQKTGKQYAFTYGPVAFLENQGDSGVVQFNGRNYTSNGGSMLLVGADGALVFDTYAVATPAASRAWTPISASAFAWSAWTDPLPAPGASAPPAQPGSTVGATVTAAAAVEQLLLTQDDTEHAVYVTSISAEVLGAALAAAPAAPGGSLATTPLVVQSAKSTALSAFFVGSGDAPVSAYEVSEDSGGFSFTLALPSAGLARLLAAAGAAGAAGASGEAAAATLVIFSESLGIHKFSSINNGPTPDTFSTSAIKGITGKVTLGGVDITRNSWTSQSGLAGEAFPPVWTAAGASRASWAPVAGGNASSSAPMTWLRTTFVSPDLALLAGTGVNASLQLDATGLSRGHFYVNDHEISRHWGARMCGGEQCQRYYHIPPDVLLAPPAANTLTVFDAEGAPALSAVRLVLSHVSPPQACGAPAAGANVSTSTCRAKGANAGQVLAFTPSASAASATTGTISVVGAAGGLCWAVGGPSPVVKAPQVTLAACAPGAAAQQWTLSAGAPGSGAAGSIVSAATGACLDIPNDVDSGGPLDLWSCNGGDNQRFTFGADGTLVSALSGRCVGVCA